MFMLCSVVCLEGTIITKNIRFVIIVVVGAGGSDSGGLAAESTASASSITDVVPGLVTAKKLALQCHCRLRY
jgi:hypothetical protein